MKAAWWSLLPLTIALLVIVILSVVILNLGSKDMQVSSSFQPGTIRWVNISQDKVIVTTYDGNRLEYGLISSNTTYHIPTEPTVKPEPVRR